LRFCVSILATDRQTHRQTNERTDWTEAVHKGALVVASGT